MATQQCDLLEILYNSIPNREKHIKTAAKVTLMEERADGVRVHLTNGGIEIGSVVFGADGATGITKGYINEMSLKAGIAASVTPPVDIPTTSRFCGIFYEGPNVHGIASGVFYETRDTGRGIQTGAAAAMFRAIM
ncbi:FAD-dependent monooxygenase srdH [Paramyrothecium foliicola]|nr:FAD-dependent monooxygenase srdH [Paramyrothecium foliicola]